ncbi:MAG TPA: hypothetical protein PLZ57_09640 [Pseudobdellovibrionaceae bacterium]|nr:hypothetical protein [Pseudobdellovibrionaceae bacterium]
MIALTTSMARASEGGSSLHWEQDHDLLNESLQVETEFFQPVSTADVAESSELTTWIEQNADRLGLAEGSQPKSRRADPQSRRVPLPPPRPTEVEMAKDSGPSGVSELADVISEMNFARSCSQMGTAQGYGPTGQVLARMLENGDLPNLMAGSADLRRACPRYANLNVEQKKLVWVTVFTAMAHLESSCNNARTAQGPNGRLRGLWQLHDGFEHRYAAGCRRGDATTATRNAACAARMLDGQLARADALFSRDSYWGVLRPQGEPRPGGGRRIYKARVIIRAVGELSICGAR